MLVCAWEEARNPGPATHERDPTAEQRTARQRRINEGVRSVPVSQDSLAQRVHNERSSLRQRRPLLQLKHRHRCQPLGELLSRGRDKNAFVVHNVVQILQLSEEPRTASSCCTWFRSSSPKRALPCCAISTAPPVKPVTFRSRRCRRCSFCRSDAPTRNLIVGDIFQDRGQPGHQDAAPGGLPSVCQPLHSSQPVPPGDPLDDSPLPTCSIRDIVLTERDKQLLAELRRASAMAFPRCIVSRHATAWAEGLEGAISGHQSCAVLCRYRCRLLLAEVPKGSDRHAELKLRLSAVRGGRGPRAYWKSIGAATLRSASQEKTSNAATN